VGNREAKDSLFDAFAEVAKALASGRRAEIFDVLAQGERSVEEVAEELGQLADRLRRGDLVVLDVRPGAEFRAGHIAGARSVPIGELRRSLRTLPKDSEVVAYCRGPYCVFADDAVRLLRRRGRSARRLEDGFPEWARADLPIDVGVAA